MSVEASVIPGSQRYARRSAQEDDRAFIAAERHSRIVERLRKGLPILAGVIFLGYFISSGFSITLGGITASVDSIQVNNGNLRMVNPTLKGADKKNGPYVINAEYADQDTQNTKILQLHALKSETNNGSGGWSRMEAIRGTFDTDAEHLVMRDDIRVHTSSGMVGTLKYATLEMKNQILRSHIPVVFDLPNGTVHANALTVRSAEHLLVFRGKVFVHLDKMQPNPAAAAKPAKSAAPLVKAPPGPSGAPEADAGPAAEAPKPEPVADTSAAQPTAP